MCERDFADEGRGGWRRTDIKVTFFSPRWRIRAFLSVSLAEVGTVGKSSSKSSSARNINAGEGYYYLRFSVVVNLKPVSQAEP